MELRTMTLEDLRDYGMRHFAELPYRVEVASRLAQYYGSVKVVTFDDVAMAVPEGQRHQLHGLPGYERALLPTLWLATGFPEGGAVLVAAPPNPVERQYVAALKRELEMTLQRSVRFEVLYEHEGRLTDLLTLSESTYDALCRQYAIHMAMPAFADTVDELYHVRMFLTHASQLLEDGPCFVMPFEVTEMHVKGMSNLIAAGYVSLPDLPDMDKARNNLWLRKQGYAHLPRLTAVTVDGLITKDADELIAREDHLGTAPRANTREHIEAYATALIRALDRFVAEGVPAMLKVDSKGVSGLGNVSRRSQPRIYDTGLPMPQRVAALADLIQHSLQGGPLPVVGVIEEFITPGTIEGVTQDYVVCGLVIDGVFLPTSVNPFGTTDGVYDRMWNAASAEQLGEDPAVWDALLNSYAEMARLMAAQGYRTGIFAGDMFFPLIQHDWNMRRGGRSTLEVMLMFRPEGWFEGQVEIDLTPHAGELSGERMYDLYTQICRELLELDIFPYSTSFGYFGIQEHEIFMKMKLMVPMSWFGDLGGPHVLRGNQLSHISEHVSRMVDGYLRAD